jgi:predicted nucleic acid-binding protein
VSTFVDTSALLAVMVRDDASHPKASEVWRALQEERASLITTNYVVLEFLAVLQRRHGMQAVRAALDSVLLVVDVFWVDQAIHEGAVQGLLAANRRDLSMVDCTSFAAMRQLGVRRVFALDPHFLEQGFEVLPG